MPGASHDPRRCGRKGRKLELLGRQLRDVVRMRRQLILWRRAGRGLRCLVVGCARRFSVGDVHVRRLHKPGR